MDPQDSQTPAITPESHADHGPAGRAKPEHHHTRLLEQFQETLEKDGEKAYERWGLAMFHSMADEDVQAQRKAFGFPLRDALDHYNEGCLLADNGDFTGAAKAFQQAVKLDAELAEAWFNHALALEEQGGKAAARDAWKAYLDKFGDHEDAAEVRQHLSETADAV